jgi:hypothetical protein
MRCSSARRQCTSRTQRPCAPASAFLWRQAMPSVPDREARTGRRRPGLHLGQPQVALHRSRRSWQSSTIFNQAEDELRVLD